ncbi:hypothetical protein SAMN02745181_2152 [Rubritalea squalenifaciens DSM 18772]|uniref:Uncharacterized protein n=1 Tax=Rubritalea squalenifaciens DSM 18772 TaxID=1123071 RepID=A0A1M6KMM9_9BACT|nr:hypothetical protein [Rubritalea squalenifaciens]SHJ60213.1 hypothetical protein SAMN02745181_2152 [Rubritalea squalenifaciens DSM 18772]
MSPNAVLTLLTFSATIVGARLYVNHELASTQPKEELTTEMRNYISTIENQVAELQKENKTLRAIAQSAEGITLPDELITFVEKDIGLTFKSPPQVFPANEDFIREAAGQRYLSAFNEAGMQMRAYAFEKLGIIPPSQQFIGQLIIAETVGSRGYYDVTAGEILLAEDFDTGSVHDQASAVRLLAIALLDQHAPLPKILTDDMFHAREAIHRGRASMLQQRFYSINARSIGFVSQRDNTEAVETFKALCGYVQALTTFPNTEGKSFAEILYQKDQAALAEALIHPPQSTKDIYLNTPPAEWSKAQEPPAPTAETPLTTSLGALTVHAFLKQVMPEKQISAIIKTYSSDTLTIETSGDQGETTTIKWSINWPDQNSAEAFLVAAKEILSAQDNGAKASLTETGVTLTFVEKPN